MKTSISILFFCLFFYVGNAQRKDYKSLLDTFFLHAETNFVAISGEPNDSTTYSPSKLKADIGEIETSVSSSYAVATLVWKIPLAQSTKIKADIQDYIRAKFLNNPNYQIASDGTEEEGYKITGVYANDGSSRPRHILQTMYYKSENEPEKSSFSITIYGK